MLDMFYNIMHFMKNLIIAVALFIYLIVKLVIFKFEEIQTWVKSINVKPI